MGNREMQELAHFVIGRATGEVGMGGYIGDQRTPTYDEIARLAFRFYESRGREDGHDIEDWLRAEQELARHYA